MRFSSLVELTLHLYIPVTLLINAHFLALAKRCENQTGNGGSAG